MTKQPGGRLVIGHWGLGIVSEHLADAGDEVGGAAAVAPLVVVPAEDLDHLALAAGLDHGALGVEDAAVGVADDVAGDDGVLGVLEDALERAGGELLEDVVDLGD